MDKKEFLKVLDTIIENQVPQERSFSVARAFEIAIEEGVIHGYIVDYVEEEMCHYMAERLNADFDLVMEHFTIKQLIDYFDYGVLDEIIRNALEDN